jgi:hypothetical protein
MSLFPRHELFQSTEKNLMAALIKNICSLEIDSDFVPHLDPFDGVTVVAEAFGCKTAIPENGDPVVLNPIIRQASDVYSLKKPALDSPVFRKIYHNLAFWADKTGGAIPIGTTDPQGPLDVAQLLWETQDFYCSFYDNKKELHYLLDMITETFIDFYSKQLEIIPNPAFPIHLFPTVDSHDGIAVSEDQVVNMSPGLYEEFGVPYLNRISEAFGGLYFHSCGNFMPFIDQICSISGLRAINGHMSPKEITPRNLERIHQKGIGCFIGISDRSVGWDSVMWDNNDLIDLYHDYYLPSAIQYSSTTGLMVTGYGSYRGYFDTVEGETGTLIIDGRGRPIEQDPFLNVPLEKKNENFQNIVVDCARLAREKQEGKDLTTNARYARFSGDGE